MSVISGKTNRVIATVKVGKGPVGITVDRRSSMIYVANSGSNTVSVLAPCIK